MARRKIAPEFRSHLSEKLMDLGNYIAVGLIIGQFVEGKFSTERMIVGIAGTLSLYIAGYIVES